MESDDRAARLSHPFAMRNALVLGLLLASCRAPSPPAPEEAPAPPAEVVRDAAPPMDESPVFSPWDGRWRGRFVVKDGEDVLTELQVEQRYRSVSPERQFGFFDERDVATGVRTTATATNSVTPDGLRCEVEKSNGERVVHRGRPTDDGGIEWFRKTPDLEEHFFEKVYTDPSGQTWYAIEGWGRYGGGPRLTFEGRYRRISDP